MIRQNKLLLSIILILATVLRVWDLTNFPAGFNADEAAIGYNAYSVLKTGSDEYGNRFPLSFKSFGDYKPGLYFYFVLPFIALFNLSELAIRLPSAIFGIVTVFLVYLISKKIFENENIGLISALLLSITPWHLHFSRGGWETNAATFFITLGLFLFLKSLEKFKYLFWSLLALLASMYTYQSPRLIVPILITVLIIVYREQLTKIVQKEKKKNIIFSILLLSVFSIPLILQFTSPSGTARYSGLTFLNDLGPQSRVNQLRGQHDIIDSFLSKMIHNKLTAYGPNFLGHYLDHFRPDFLFINGDPIIRNKVPEVGQFYLIESLFLILGIVYLIKYRSPYSKFLFSWVLIAPLASSITYQTPHALRSLNMVIPLTLFISFGLWKFYDQLKPNFKNLMILIVGTIFVFELIHYLESYYIHYPKRYPIAWEYGFKEMVSKLHKYESDYSKIVITDRYDQPYILVLFYKKYDPKKYQPQAVLTERDKFNFGTVRAFDKYEFRSIKPEETTSNKSILYIGTEREIAKDAMIIDKVLSPSGKPLFIFATKKWVI